MRALPAVPRHPVHRLRLFGWPGVAAVGVALLTGCGGSGDEPQAPNTVTVTESSSGSDEAPDEAPEAEPEGTPASDVTERSHDAGAIVDVTEVAGRQVLVLDRWTVIGLDDAALAADGAPVVAHADERFTNQNDRSTYDVPVADDVMVIVNECVPADDPAAPPGISSSQSTLEDLLARPDLAELPLLLTYDEGHLVQVDTDAAC